MNVIEELKHDKEKSLWLNILVRRLVQDRLSDTETSSTLSGSFVGVYDSVLTEIDGSLLKITMQYVNGNQSKAARMLGLSRGTLRKKLKIHGML